MPRWPPYDGLPGPPVSPGPSDPVAVGDRHLQTTGESALHPAAANDVRDTVGRYVIAENKREVLVGHTKISGTQLCLS